MELTARHPGPRLAAAGEIPADLTPEPDDRVAVLAGQGCAKACDELARRYRGRLTVFCRSFLPAPEDAEDAAQETLLKAIGALPGYRPRGQFRAWIFAIAANVCRGQRRRSRLLPESELRTDLPQAADPCFRSALAAAVRGAVDRLPLTYRAPVVLFYLEEMPVAEIAAVLGRSSAAVKVQLWRARTLLARELADWMD